MTDNAGLKGAAQIAAQQVASTKNVRIKPDIVERLRSSYGGQLTDVAREAADEIERLRKQWEYFCGLHQEEHDKAEAEIERLRTQVHDLTEAVNIEYVGSITQARNAALEEAAKVADGYDDGSTDPASGRAERIAEDIRALKDNQ